MRRKLHPGARTDLIDAQRWYDSKERGLGRRFRQSVDEGVARVMRLPLAAPLWPGIDTELNVRKYVLRRFPYSIAYLLQGDVITILAVAHQRRQPDYWLDRIG
ncbi:MAG: type II toxin-antitoxin system RelE/ParE family toxin [Proteobacteria bacterium]|nr:type II toxin-antitoxin system RelE/ParE family toxin [Pseudomonadota bacterium]